MFTMPYEENSNGNNSSDGEEVCDLDDVLADLDLITIPTEVQEYAEIHLGENEEMIQKSIQELQDIIEERDEIMPHRIDDDFLLRFLRARNYKLEPAYRLLVNYCQFRENNPTYYQNVDPLSLGFIGDADVLSVLPYREQNGRRIMIFRLGKWNTSDYSIDELFKATLAILELGILEPRAQILGGLVIFDLDGLTLQQAWQITPSVATKVMDLIGVSFPMKTIAIHIINESWVFDIVYTVFKQFMSAKYLERINFHGSNMESLHAHICPKYLPKRYGGIRPDYPYIHWFQNLSRNEKIIKEMKSLGYSRAGETKYEDLAAEL